MRLPSPFAPRVHPVTHDDPFAPHFDARSADSPCPPRASLRYRHREPTERDQSARWRLSIRIPSLAALRSSSGRLAPLTEEQTTLFGGEGVCGKEDVYVDEFFVLRGTV